MSAEELISKGNELRESGRNGEAIQKYDQAISLDPTNGYPYALRAFSYKALGHYEQAVESYKKALSLGENGSWIYHDLGFLLTFKIKRREEALVYFNKAQELDSSNLGALLLDKGNCLIALGKTEEAKRDFLIAIEHKSQYAETYSYAGGFLEEEGKREEALKLYNQGLGFNGNDLNCGLLKASVLNDLGKKHESLQMYQHLLSLYPTEAVINYRMGSLYDSLGNHTEAKKRYETGATSNGTSVSALCAIGQCLSVLGKHEEAMEKYKEAQNKLLDPDGLEITLPTFLKKVKVALKAVLEAEETSKQVEAATVKLDQNLPAVQKFLTNIKSLQVKKNEAQNKVLDQVNKKGDSGPNKDLAYLDQIKEEYKKELEALKREMSDFKTEVRTEIKTIKNNMEEMKEELNSKMDDFHKKLDIELNKQDLSDDDKKKLKAYFSAFIGTFSSAHVSAQVVDSGMVQLDSESSTATVLSFMASFAPFVGSALETGIKSIGDFLATKEMKSNARKLKGLAPDAVVLSQVVGKTGFNVLTHKKKQQQILTTTDKQLNEVTGNVFKKIYAFCEKVSEKIDVYLYTNLYKTTAERIGHNDANELIGEWTSGKIMPYDIDTQFTDHILKPFDEQAGQGQKETPTQEIKRAANDRNGSCCNMF